MGTSHLRRSSSPAIGSILIIRLDLSCIDLHCCTALINWTTSNSSPTTVSCKFRPSLYAALPSHIPDSLVYQSIFSKSLLKDKFKVLMSPLALQLASQKLRQDNLVMLATIINQKVVFEKLEPVDPSIVESDDRESWSLISLPGYHPGKW
jgi:hypothetical protein